MLVRGQSGCTVVTLSAQRRHKASSTMWDKMKGVKWAEIAWLLECFSGRFVKVFGKKRVSSIGVNVIRSPFPCVRGFGRGEAKCEDAGKEINVEQAGTELPPGHRKPETWREEMKESQAATSRAKNGSQRGQEPSVLMRQPSSSLCSLALSFLSAKDKCVHPKWVPNQAVS